MFYRLVLVFSAVFAALSANAQSRLSAEAQEFGLETFHMIEATEALFEALEASTAEAAPKANTLQLRVVRPEAAPVAMDLPEAGQMAMRPDLGPVSNLLAYNVTWYPTDRLLGSVDFMGTWGSGRNLICGYATWDMSEAEAPTLVAMTTAYVDTRTLIGLSADAAHGELLRANCAFGEIEPNLEYTRALVSQS